MTVAHAEVHAIGRRSGLDLTLRISVLSALLAGSQAALCGEPAPRPPEECIDAAGSCFELHATAGCDDAECCTAVCKADPFCCEIEWDQVCVDFADELCELPPICPGKGSCFEVHGTPGCDDEACCILTCTFDSFCCGAEWDVLCTQVASALCDQAAVEVTCPPSHFDEVEDCGAFANDGCNMGNDAAFSVTECGATYCGTMRANPPRDTDWYLIDVPVATDLGWQVTAEFPVHLALITLQGECDGGSITIEDQTHGDPGEVTTLSRCVDPGTYYLFVSTGITAKPLHSGLFCPPDPKDLKDPKFVPPPMFYGNDYVATALCNECAADCPTDLTGDGVVGPADIAQVLGNWGPVPSGTPADLTGDGVVGPADLAKVLGTQGACP